MFAFEELCRPSTEEAEQLKSNFNENCRKAAYAVSEADVLILVTGAGFSADSGLAVYADVANIKAYRERGLKYHDICQPEWLSEEPELFYGFWGQCFNDYRKTKAHEGYDIIARWRNDKNHSKTAQAIRSYILEAEKDQKKSQGNKSVGVPCDPYKVKGRAGAFFAFTSNVDAHNFDVFDANEIRECHGNVELWQCEVRNCGGHNKIWCIPLDHSFFVDPETMLAPLEKEDLAVNTNNLPSDTSDSDATARIGHTLGSNRQNTLRYMEKLDNDDWVYDNQNWPKCCECGRLARPAIMMFGDMSWKDNKAQLSRWHSWQSALYKLTELKEKAGNSVKVCILEIGCGLNVATCRWQSEELCRDIQMNGGDVTLVRVNPDFPLADDEDITDHTVSIMSRGLTALKVIDEFYNSTSKE